MSLIKNCQSCGAEIVFMKTTKGKKSPVNVESIPSEDWESLHKDKPVIFDPKRHLSHFATCPDGPKYRNKQ